MKVILGLPWRYTYDRLEAYNVTTGILPQLYEFDAMFTADSGHPKFNRSATRNLIFEVAEENNADVVVCCDADSVPEEAALRAAISAAVDGGMHFPFHEVWYVENKGMQRVKNRASTEQIRSRIIDKCQSEGGIWVCTPETWRTAGGQDPRLANWGCDDRAFLAASRTLVGMPNKHHGILMCLPHLRPTDKDIWIPEEVQLMIEYQDAYQQPQKMKEIIDARPNDPMSLAESSEERSPDVRVLSGNLRTRHKTTYFGGSE